MEDPSLLVFPRGATVLAAGAEMSLGAGAVEWSLAGGKPPQRSPGTAQSGIAGAPGQGTVAETVDVEPSRTLRLCARTEAESARVMRAYIAMAVIAMLRGSYIYVIIINESCHLPFSNLRLLVVRHRCADPFATTPRLFDLQWHHLAPLAPCPLATHRVVFHEVPNLTLLP